MVGLPPSVLEVPHGLVFVPTKGEYEGFVQWAGSFVIEIWYRYEEVVHDVASTQCNKNGS